MSALDATLDQFGHTLQLPVLALNAEGVATMEIEDYGRVYFEKHRAGLVVLVLRQLPSADVRYYARALTICDPREKLPFQPLAALRSQRELVLGFFLEESAVTVPVLQEALQALGQLHDQVASA